MNARAERRGMALLLALAVVVIVTTAIASALAAAGAATHEAVVGASEHRIDDALASGEAIAIAWVGREASRIVLPPEGGGVAVSHDRWSGPDGQGSLQVDLYDGLGGIPIEQAIAGAPLRLALPQPLRGIIVPRDASLPTKGQGTDILERIDCPACARRFPVPLPAPVTFWGAGTGLSQGTAAQVDQRNRPSLAVAVCPHAEHRININTAPVEVLELAYQALGREGVDALIERRRGGTFSEATGSAGEPKDIRLVDSSMVWNAAITASWNGVTRTWWVVIAGNPRQMRIVQRHVADR